MAEQKNVAAKAAAKKDNKTPRERFLTVGAGRVSRAMKGIRGVKNISSRKSYEYSEPEARKAIAALRAEVDAVEKAFNDALSGKTGKATAEAFSFA